MFDGTFYNYVMLIVLIPVLIGLFILLLSMMIMAIKGMIDDWILTKKRKKSKHIQQKERNRV